MKIRSLTKQVIVAILTAEFVCASVFSGAALVHEWHARMHALDTTLRGRADSLLGAIQDAEDPDDNVYIDPAELDLPKDDVYAVYKQDGRLLGSSRIAPADLIAKQQAGIDNRHFAGETYRVLQHDGMRIIDREENHGIGLRRPVTILYAVKSDRVWHEVREAVSFYVTVGASLIGLTGLIMIVILRRILSPIEALASEAASISLHSLNFIAPQSALQVKELRPLATALTDAGVRLARGFEQQTRFVGDAAHELKTAVAVVRSSLQLLLLRPRTNSHYVAGLQEALTDNMRVEELITRMLVSARVEEQLAGTAQRTTEVIDVSVVAAQVAGRLRSLASTHKITLAFNADGAPRCRISQEEFGVALSNLLVNAMQYSGENSSVSLSIAEEEQSAVVRVEDWGHGISAEALPHVFERFYREDSSRSRESGGAGLGLAICKSIIDAAHGTIAIESTPSIGTVATIRLPAA